MEEGLGRDDEALGRSGFTVQLQRRSTAKRTGRTRENRGHRGSKMDGSWGVVGSSHDELLRHGVIEGDDGGKRRESTRDEKMRSGKAGASNVRKR